MLLNEKIYVAGHRGLVGSAILRKLTENGFSNLVVRNRKELDLKNQERVYNFFGSQKIDYVFLAAAKVGGIMSNSNFPAEFIRDNLQIQTNVIDASHRFGVKKILFLGSSCIYPKFSKQPIKEEYLLTSSLEPTNKAYAIAKIAGLEMCRSYYEQYELESVCAMPTNLYGKNDNFDLKNSHVLPALLRKFHKAVEQDKDTVEIWGTGTVKRELLFADDLAEACIFLMNLPREKFRSVAPDGLINIGVGKDISIRELALLIGEIIGFNGELEFDTSKPDGTPRKVLDVSRMEQLGWSPKKSLREGIKETYTWLQDSILKERKLAE